MTTTLLLLALSLVLPSKKGRRGRSFNSKQSIEAVKVGRSYLIKILLRRFVPLSGKKTDFLTYC